MKILVINAGSSSLKFQLIDMETETAIAKGNCERVTIDGSFLNYKANGKKVIIEKEMPNHEVAIELVLNTLLDKENGVISSLEEINAVGHRVVNGGDLLNQTTLVTDEVMEKLRNCIDFAPLHIPGALKGLEAVRKVLPNVNNVLVFDTTFHTTMPDYAYRYAIPKEYYEKYHIRRYGAHGTSHKFVSEEYFNITGKKPEGTKLITCHLGSGSSITAIKDGKCVDTSMGFTPLEGLVMGTRCGDIDASILEYINKKTGKSLSEITTMLNKQSGIYGLCGYSDMRDIENNLDKYDVNLANEMLVYKVRKYIGSYIAVLEGVDAIIFTAGIGEHSKDVRDKVLNHFKYLGVELLNDDEIKEEKNFTKLSTDNSKVDVYIIPTNEELVIARETLNMVK